MYASHPTAVSQGQGDGGVYKSTRGSLGFRRELNRPSGRYEFNIFEGELFGAERDGLACIHGGLLMSVMPPVKTQRDRGSDKWSSG